LLRSILRAFWLALGWLLLAIGAVCSFGALWFDFPIAALRHALAIVSFCGALAALVLVRPRWRAKLGLVIGIALIAAWWLTIRPSNSRDWQTDVAEIP
jgi:predicted MFS family arabinose efflux permease